MKKILLALLITLFVVANQFVFATPVSNDGENININVDVSSDNIPKAKKKNSADDILLYYRVQNKDKNKDKEKDKDKKSDNINVEILQNDRVFSESSIRISAIYPYDSPQNSYPGYRGVNQLVIYERGFGQTTGTNEYGKEAVVVNGIVTALTGANSTIPQVGGFVISGHGSAKKWISDNLKIGTKVDILDRTLRAYTTIDSYRYCAKVKIEEVQSIMKASRHQEKLKDDKKVASYLKRAKLKYKKSLKDNSDQSFQYALEAAEDASMAFRYTLPYIKDEMRGTWVRPESASLSEIQSTLDKMKAAGINNVFLETFFHGKTIFPSMTMREYGFEEENPKFRGVDVLSLWINEAHKRNIKVHCWFESFYLGSRIHQNGAKSIMRVRPDWSNRTRLKADEEAPVVHTQEHNGYFLDPANPEVIGFLLSLMDEIATKYKIDGINIDYVRYPNISKDNYGNQWGYTKFAREEFKILYEVDPIDLTKDDPLFKDWCEYRCDKITDYIRKVSNVLKSNKIMFSVVIFPDYKVSLKTKFQDWSRWASLEYVDAYTPLILTSDDALAKSMLEEIKKKSHDTKIYPGLFAGFIESDPEDLLKQIRTMRSLELSGVILFDWAHLNSNYLDVLKTSVFKVKDVK